jgi:DNA topoisomerase IB/2'-5' RNA ligase
MLRRADTPKKYEHIDFTPPKSVANAAEKGLEYREKASPSNKGGLTVSEASKQGIGSGVQRAVNLKNRNTLSPDTIKQMHGFFSRHEKNKGVAPEHKSEPWNDKGNVAWLLWGGDPGQAWAAKVLGQMEAADEKEKAVKKAAMGFARCRTASVNGDGSSVGFFIPLSAELASQYEVKPEDTSPPHVTFLYVGKVAPEQVSTFLRVARGVLQDAPPVFGVLNGVDSFVQKDKNQRVLYSRVSFSHDLKPLRDRLWAALTEAGFKVEQAFPAFTPHVTIEYRDGLNDAVLDQAAPLGSWDCKTIEVWGLPKKYTLPLGGRGGKQARTASGMSLSLDDLGYGSLTTDEEALLLAPSTAFPAEVLALIPQVPCPENSSEETRRELAYLLRLQQTARPYLAQQVVGTDENATSTLEAYCAKHGLDASGVLPVVRAARSVLLQVKRLYNRPRPYQLAEYLEPGFHPMPSTTAHTPSYPSGHSAQAVLVALLLSGLYPEHREAFMALAKEVGQHRMVGGYHFPSDVAYGEQIGRVLYESMARASVRTAAAKYKDKKQVPKADGSGKTTVYVYSERQVANRHREKAERLEDFKPALAELRAQVKKDLDSDDPKKNLVALAVGLIDATYERVGNDESADNGHYGVTGWLRKHVTFKGKRAVIRYTGKSGVKHEKSVDDEALVGALKKCCGDKDGEEQVLSLGKHAVTSGDVNKYLKPYGITAKDLRGLHANREMQERLRAIRSKGPKLPRLRKERDPILKEEFKQALEGAAEAVGHEPSTLRKQYLVPGIEDAYMKDGTVPRDLTASTRRVAALYLRATKSDAEREDEEAERLVKPEPKYKPPRGDLRRRRVDTERDDDPDKKQDDKDRSQNYKDASVRAVVQRVAAAWLFKVGQGNPLMERAKKEFEAYEKKHPDTELDVNTFLERLAQRSKTTSGGSNTDAETKADAAHYAQQERKVKTERVQKLVDKVSAEWAELENSLPLTSENRKRISSSIDSYTPKQREEFAKAFASAREAHVRKYSDEGYDPDAVSTALLDMDAKFTKADPKRVAEHAVEVIFTDRVLLNPMLLTPDDPLSDDEGKGTADPKKSAARVSQSIQRFSRASKRERAEMSKRLDAAIREAPEGTAKQEELLAVRFGLTAAEALHPIKEDGDDEGKADQDPKPPKGMSKVEFGLLQHLADDSEKSSELLGLSFRASRKDKSAQEDTRKFVREATRSMKPEQINNLLPEEMQSASLAVRSLLKEMASDRASFRKSKGKSTAKEDAAISEYEAEMDALGDMLGERLSDLVADSVGRKVQPEDDDVGSVYKNMVKNRPKLNGGKPPSKKDFGAFLDDLMKSFRKLLGNKGVTAHLHLAEPPRVSVGGLYHL